MTRRHLEQLRPWLDPKRRPIDNGYPPAMGIVSKGYIEWVVDRFYKLTEKGQREAEELIGRPL